MGLLYPAYCSYKAVKTKNVKEYVSNDAVSVSYTKMMEGKNACAWFPHFVFWSENFKACCKLIAGELDDVLDCVLAL